MRRREGARVRRREGARVRREGARVRREGVRVFIAKAKQLRVQQCLYNANEYDLSWCDSAKYVGKSRHIFLSYSRFLLLLILLCF